MKILTIIYSKKIKKNLSEEKVLKLMINKLEVHSAEEMIVEIYFIKI